MSWPVYRYSVNVKEPPSSSDPRVSAFIDKNQTWIVLDDPSNLNALDPEFVRALAEQIEAVKTKYLILTGRNGAFSSGGQLETVSALAKQAETDKLGVEAIVREGGNLVEDILFSNATTVALIDGVCAGAGIGVALACDIQLATARARYSTAYAKLGLPTDFGTRELLRHRIGDEAADEMIKNAELIGVGKAQKLGLVDATIERIDPKAVKKALKELKAPNRKSLLKSMSAVLDAEAADFARALKNPKVQVKVEKALTKKHA